MEEKEREKEKSSIAIYASHFYCYKYPFPSIYKGKENSWNISRFWCFKVVSIQYTA